MNRSSGNQKKFKLSILKRIAVLCMFALILSSVIATIISYNYMIENAARQGEDIARVVATAAQTAIGSKDNLYALMSDEQFREKTHKTFRYICAKSGVRYLFLYTVDDNECRHYIICAANSDEDDTRINTKYGFGSTDDNPLYNAERTVLNGDDDGEYEFINNGYGNVCSFILPIREKSELLGLIGVDYTIESITDIALNNIRIMLLQRMLVIGLALVLSIVFIRQSVIVPIIALSERMRNFVKDKKINVTSNKRKTMFEDEITDIEGSFDEMANDISRYVDDIKLLANEKAQNRAQLDVARKIQAGIVLQEHCCLGNGFKAYGCEHPAKEVGGDFYDIFSPDHDNICVIVGDISGKGVSAAMFMVMVKTVIKEKIKAGYALDDTLNLVNREICLSNPENMFATVFAMILNTRTGVVRYANAGHEPPLILKKESSFLDMDHGVALGLFEDSGIIMEELILKDGEGILIYTDGITESINENGVQFGKSRLMTSINRSYALCENSHDPDILVRGLVSSVKGHSNALEQFDDITCAALTYKKMEESKIKPDLESFYDIRQAIMSSLGDSSSTRRIILACEEIFANIVNYSTADSVSFSGEKMGNVYSVTFTDNGVPFDPVNSVIKEKKFEELADGGMGINLVKKTANEMVYMRLDERNILTLNFNI